MLFTKFLQTCICFSSPLKKDSLKSTLNSAPVIESGENQEQVVTHSLVLSIQETIHNPTQILESRLPEDRLEVALLREGRHYRQRRFCCFTN